MDEQKSLATRGLHPHTHRTCSQCFNPRNLGNTQHFSHFPAIRKVTHGHTNPLSFHLWGHIGFLVLCLHFLPLQLFLQPARVLFDLVFFFFLQTIFSSYSLLKDVLHRCDRAMIYVFIAGSYFPWLTLEPLPNDGWASSMSWFVWILALLGIVYQQTFHEKYKSLETCFYLVMGIGPAICLIQEVSIRIFDSCQVEKVLTSC